MALLPSAVPKILSVLAATVWGARHKEDVDIVEAMLKKGRRLAALMPHRLQAERLDGDGLVSFRFASLSRERFVVRS